MHAYNLARLPAGGESEAGPACGTPIPRNTIGAQLHEVPGRTYSSRTRTLESVREGREMIRETTVKKLHATDAKLSEVTAATETVASAMLDGLDRALALIERIERAELGGRRGPETEGLRREIYGVMDGLQFQDILAQQLSHASSILHEMEAHLAELVRGFGMPGEAETGQAAIPARAFDANAALAPAADRQALADELLAR